MTQPRRDTPADDPRVDRIREAMRYHDDRLAPDSEGTERNLERDDTPEPEEPREGEQAEESGEA